jgi:hypothetical protein
MADNVGLPKNTFGHTLWNDSPTAPANQIAEESLHVTVDERGERRVKVDLFDSPVMKDFIAKQRQSGTIVQEADGSVTVKPLVTVPQAPLSYEEAAAQQAAAATLPRRTLGDPKSLEDFDKYMQAYHRGDDLSNVPSLEEDEEEDDYGITRLTHAPAERSPLDGPCGVPVIPSAISDGIAEGITTRLAQTVVREAPVPQQPRIPAVPTALTEGARIAVKTLPERKAPPIPLTPAVPCDKGCGAALPLVAKFCWWCGNSQQAKFCTDCGYHFIRDEKFCPDCGSAR